MVMTLEIIIPLIRLRNTYAAELRFLILFSNNSNSFVFSAKNFVVENPRNEQTLEHIFDCSSTVSEHITMQRYTSKFPP